MSKKNVIQETRDYDQFALLDANRDTQRPHIEAIKKSIERNGNFTKFSPVLVNERLQIIDGQHRFTALKELGLPIFYIIADGSGVRQAREMNKLNKGWGMMDWAKTYAVSGSTSYKNFLTLHEEYPEIAPSVLLMYAAGGEEKGMFSEFRDGDFIFPDQALDGARKRIERLQEAQEANPSLTNGEMLKAFLYAMNLDGYDHKRMLTKLKEIPELLSFQKYNDNLRHLEEVYNYHYKAGNRLRFY